jgi:predicted pyridoxine 5'-phosphate oxidase superfamily flavin-nucleotide-binding protein
VAHLYERIDDHLRAWIARQPMYFVATAPRDDDGHVNVSPKGPMGTLRVIDDHTVAYLDYGGSGSETIAHLRENGRIVVMLCAFEGPPKIVRLHGRGEVVLPGDQRFAELVDELGFDELSAPEARRSVIVVDVTRVSDSCGYGVPLMAHEGERPHHRLSVEKRLRTMGADGYRAHRARSDAESIDGLPAIPAREPA